MVPAYFIWLIQQFIFTKPEDRDKVNAKTYVSLIIPSVCDLLCTLLLLVAQLYITASLWQMMRGSVIVITAVLKIYGLGHSLEKHMKIGIGMIAFSMLLVAFSAFVAGPVASGADLAGGAADARLLSNHHHHNDDYGIDADPLSAPTDVYYPDQHSAEHGHLAVHLAAPVNDRNPMVGVALVVLGCLAQGVQYVFEEKVMNTGDVNCPPLVVIGMEGIWGFFITVLIVYPLAYYIPGKDNGSFENPFDSWEMVVSNERLSYLVTGFVVTVTMYNIAAVYVTQLLSAIWHAILDNFRPISVWGLDLAMFYYIAPGTGLGEEWTPGSWLQLIGLCILLFGTAVYNGSITIAGFCEPSRGGYEAIDSDEPTGRPRTNTLGEIVEDMIKIRTDPAMAASALTRSPLITNSAERESERARERSGSFRSGSYSRTDSL